MIDALIAGRPRQARGTHDQQRQAFRRGQGARGYARGTPLLRWIFWRIGFSPSTTSHAGARR